MPPKQSISQVRLEQLKSSFDEARRHRARIRKKLAKLKAAYDQECLKLRKSSTSQSEIELKCLAEMRKLGYHPDAFIAGTNHIA